MARAETWAGNLFAFPSCFGLNGFIETLADDRLGWLSPAALRRMAFATGDTGCIDDTVRPLMARLRTSPGFTSVAPTLRAELGRLLRSTVAARRTGENLSRLVAVLSMAHELGLPIMDDQTRNDLMLDATQAGALDLYLLAIEPAPATPCDAAARALAGGVVLLAQNSSSYTTGSRTSLELAVDAARCLQADDATSLLDPTLGQASEDPTVRAVRFTVLQGIAGKLTSDEAEKALDPRAP